MPLTRLVAALVSSLLLLQLMLAGGDGACGSRARRDGPIGTMAAHPSHAPSSPSSDDACTVRHSPGACVSMPSCVSTIVLPPAVALRASLAASSDVRSEPIAMASHARLGPDVPPPRG
jgi:hypothetical protein